MVEKRATKLPPGILSLKRLPLTPEYERLLKQVEDLFRYEADLLDFRQYDEWLDLLTDDVRYFMPLARNVQHGDWDREYTREGEDIAWFDEGKEILTRRVRQIETGIHWAEEPSSRQSHLISNTRIIAATPDVPNATEVTTTSRFLAYRNRLNYETDIMVGKRVDRLRLVDGNWLLCWRMILLDQSVLLEKNLTTFL